jgi:hypothetical protein
VESSSSEPKSYQPSACLSGDHFYFLGVDLKDPVADAVVRVVVDPLEGPILRLTSPTGVLRLDRNSCSTFRVSIDPTGWRVNHVRDFSGSLDLDCVTGSAAHVSGSVAFQHCH